MYYLKKVGSYGHGVFWIGDDIEEGKRMADKAANADCDYYHDWKLFEYVDTGEINFEFDGGEDNGHVFIYKGYRKKGSQPAGEI